MLRSGVDRVSRGLGRHQRNIKRFIEKQDELFRQHCLGDDYDSTGPVFWTTWTDIRISFFEYLKSNKWIWGPNDPKWLAQERAAKRALYTLCKRGEIGRIQRGDHFIYMAAQTYNEGFSPQAQAELKEILANLGKPDERNDLQPDQ